MKVVRFVSSLAAWPAVIALAAAGLGGVARAGDVNVVVNGTAIVFDQPPVQRAGRLFVPVRGIFERLGASVVAAGKRINASAGAHTIALTVGENGATVDGTATTLDDPPFLAGGRVLVPLRFIAQALGATVKFDNATQTVSIVQTAFAAPAPVAAAPLPATPPATNADLATAVPTAVPTAATGAGGDGPIALRLLRLEPARGATLVRKRPEISATFSEAVDPKTARVALDGRDVTADAYLNARAVVYDPSFDLPAGDHRIALSGKTPANENFAADWSFTTRDGPNANYLSGLEPVSGIAIASPAEISGFTRPKARIHIVATTSGATPNFNDGTDATTTIDAIASAKGYFTALLELVDRGSGLADVRVVSTAPDGSVAVRTLRLRL